MSKAGCETCKFNGKTNMVPLSFTANQVPPAFGSFGKKIFLLLT